MCKQKSKRLQKKGLDMLIGVLIVSHGKFSTELLRSAELIIGKQENVSTLNLNEGDDIQELNKKVQEQIQRLDKGKGVLVLTDLFGGSPSNVTMANMQSIINVSSLTGVNLPMVIEAFSLRHNHSLQELAKSCYKAGVEGVKEVNKLINQR